MTQASFSPRLDRRAFLRAGGGLGVAGLGVLLAACGSRSAATSQQPTAASAAPTSSSAVAKPAAAAGGNARSVLPTYAAFQLPFKADVPSPAAGIEDAW